MTYCFLFIRSGRCLASGLILLLLLVGGARTGRAHGRGPARCAAAWAATGTGRGNAKCLHRHRKGLLHGLLEPGCQRHHSRW